MRLIRRLDEVDRRFGLSPRPGDNQRSRNWRRVCLGVALAYLVVQLVLIIAGRSSWVLAPRVTGIWVLIVIGAVVIVVLGRRRAR